MPTSGRPRSPLLEQPTRRQLDELDALMERMLALPVDLPDDTAVSPAPPAASTPVVSEPSKVEAERPKIEAAPASPASVPASVITPSEKSADDAGRAALPLAAKVVTLLASPQKTEESPTRPVAPRQERAAALRIAWPLRPLLWLNVAFDYSTAWLGPIGRWLRGPTGRAVLGWAGLLLLAAALAWLVWDGMGWTWWADAATI